MGLIWVKADCERAVGSTCTWVLWAENHANRRRQDSLGTGAMGCVREQGKATQRVSDLGQRSSTAQETFI